MISVTVGGVPCWLLPYQPGDQSDLRLSVSIPLDSRRGLTGVSSRRPSALAPRFTFQFRAVIGQAEFAKLRASTIAMQDEPVLCPLWPHAFLTGGTLVDSGGLVLEDDRGNTLTDSSADARTITGGLVVAYNSDFSAYAINPANFDGFTVAAPLVYGRFKKPPRLVAFTDGFIVAEFVIEEDSPASLALAPAAGILPADTMFANAAGVSAPVFPFLCDWSSPPQPTIAVADVDREAIGPGRQLSSSFYPQTPEQIQVADFSGIGAAEAAQIIAWWIRRAGGADAHWVATSQSLWHLAASAPAGATSLTLTLDTPAPAVGDCLALNGATTEFVRVTAVAGNVVTLAAALVNAWDRAVCRVSPAILARHTDQTLELSYSPAGWVASYQLSWREVAAEFSVPAGEVAGTTLGRLPADAWFFQIDLDYNGATASTYLTNWESGVPSLGGHTWTYNPCDFDRLTKSDDLEDDSCTLSIRWFAGCPWENWQPGVLAARGFLTLYRADVSPSGVFSNFAQVWKGELSTPTPRGANLSVKVLGANAMFARRAPRQVMSPACGTSFLSPRCGLLLADWNWTAVVAAASGNVVTIGTISRTNGGGNPAGFGAANWFALGWLQWTTSGKPQREGILGSAAISGGQIVLTLDRPFPLAPGASVAVVPGCDKQGGTCSDKFNNLANNRGFPFMPSISPSLIIPQQQQTKPKK